MASAYGIVHQYGEPQSTFDPQLAAGVLEARQNKFDTNVVKVEQTLGQLGLSMAMLARDKDKKYMYEKMSSLVNSVNNLEGTDFSSNESTRSILSTVNEALDGEVIKQLGESKKIRDFQQGIQSRIEAEDGSYSDLNYQDAMQNADYDKYMNGETESLKSFNYVPYVDTNRELLARIKEAKEVIGKRTVETILPDGSVSQKEVSNFTISEQTVVHDLLDGETINPHERKDFFIQRRKIIEGKNMIEDEINHSFDIARVIKDTGSKLNVVISNHEVFLDRHINDMDWKKDLYNSPTYLKYAHIFQTVDLTEYGSLYGYLLKKEFGDEVAYINFNESLDICGYECGSHTDFGVNGAKGSPLTFARLNTKMIGAHGHSPLILDGFSRVGVTCNLDQYYTRKGLSSWAYAHSIIHNNCKNQLLVFTDDLQLSGLI